MVAHPRADTLAEGLFGSFTLGAGQFCTKPGVADDAARRGGSGGHRGLTARVNAAAPGVLLNDRISDSFTEIATRLVEKGQATVVASGTVRGDGSASDGGFEVAPRLLKIDIELPSSAA